MKIEDKLALALAIEALEAIAVGPNMGWRLEKYGFMSDQKIASGALNEIKNDPLLELIEKDIADKLVIDKDLAKRFAKYVYERDKKIGQRQNE
jgi:hypothetical protein